jgi:broad-specificity NMP kinase
MVPGTLDVKGTRILAKSLFKELRGNGYSPNQILNLSTELIDLVTQDLRIEHAGEGVPEPILEAQSGAWRAAL